MGFVCMTFDLRGHAHTDDQRETASRDHNLRDLVGAYDMLVKHPGSRFQRRRRDREQLRRIFGRDLTSMRPYAGSR